MLAIVVMCCVPDVVNGDEIGNQAGQAPLLKLLCGADLLESFGTPGIWKSEDVGRPISFQ